jgi:hypothetical protein
MRKTCSQCGLEKPVEDFAKNNRSKDGRKAACKACLRAAWHEDGEINRAKKRERHSANKDAINAKRRLDRAADVGAARARARAYYADNRDRVQEINQRSAAKHKVRVQAYNRRYYQEHHDDLRAAARVYWEANKDWLSAKNRERWEANKELYQEASRRWMERNRAKMLAYYQQRGVDHRQELALLKEAPCMDCGGHFPPFVMEFDHVRGSKRSNLGKMANYRREHVATELAKCDLVCANCHRVRSHARRVQTNNTRLQAFRAWIASMKAVPCTDCGERLPPEAMDFDHLQVKSWQVSDMWSYSREKAVAEIAKCELVCANCHRVRTQTRRNGAS